MSAALASWADATTVGYPLLAAGVFIGSVVPVLPTGAVVGAAAAFATTTGELGLALVLAVATVAALAGDLVTFAVCRSGGPWALRWVARGRHLERIDEVREQFRRHGWQIIVAGRLLPAGRIPVLVAAGALAYPWRRLVPASASGALLWAVAYAALGVLSGGIFDSPLLATLLATLLVFVVAGALNVVGGRRRRSPGPGPEEPPAGTAERSSDPGRTPSDPGAHEPSACEPA